MPNNVMTNVFTLYILGYLKNKKIKIKLGIVNFRISSNYTCTNRKNTKLLSFLAQVCVNWV